MDRGRLYFGSKEETVFWIPLVPELRHVLSNCGRDMAAAADKDILPLWPLFPL